MTQTKQLISTFIITLFLFAFSSSLILAQSNDAVEEVVNDDITYEAETETEVEDDTTSGSQNTTPARPPVNIRPVERNTANIPLIENRRVASSTNSEGLRGGNTGVNFQNSERLSLEERQAQMEAKRLEIQANQTERRAALQENAQERISNFAASVSHRMNEAIARIEQVIERIESRVEKIKANGVDTSEAERYLDAAKADLSTASSILAGIDIDVVGAVTSEDPKTAWTEVRATYQSARDAIRSAHTNMKEAIVSLKSAMGVRGENETDENQTTGENE